MKIKHFCLILVFISIASSAVAEKYIKLDGPLTEVWVGPAGDIGHNHIVHRNDTTVPWYLNSNGAGAEDGYTFLSTKAILETAFAAWDTIQYSDISFDFQDSTPNTWGNDNKNVLYWAEEGSSAFGLYEPLGLGGDNIFAMTVFTINSSDEMVDVDIIFNGRDHEWNSNNDFPDIQAVATHEIGHMIGLHHSEDEDATMYVPYTSANPIGWQTPAFDDIIGASFLYGGNLLAEDVTLNSYPSYFMWDITVSSITTLDANNCNIYVNGSKDINVYGTLILDGESITKIPGGSDWGNIEVESGGEVNITGNTTIEYSNNYAIDVHTGGTLDIDGKLTIQESYQGIDIEYGAVFEKEYGDSLTIAMLDGLGLRLNSNSSTIRNVAFHNCGQGVRVIGATSNPNLQYLTIRNPNSWGMLIDDNSDATLSYSIIDESVSGTYPYNVWLDSGADIQLYMGENDFYPGSEYAIYMHASADDVYAGGNYWGSGSPVWTNIFNYYPSKVTVGYYYSTDRDYGAYKPALSSEQDNASSVQKQLNEALGYENAGCWSAAGTTYQDVLLTTDNPTFRRQALKALLRVADQSTKDYSGLRQLIQLELTNCPKRHEPLYDNLLCELFAREGRYQEAIAAYESLFTKYDNTETGVDILTHLAVLYGNILNDEVKAKEYADRAAAINPGQMTLEFAYEAAGMIYEPSKHVDVFSASQELSDGEPLQPEEETETIAEFIGNSPNPFNPATTFTFAIGDAGHVTLDVYSIAGQKVATLIDNTLSAGAHSAVFDGSGLGSGMYFYRFQSPGLTKNGKMLLVK